MISEAASLYLAPPFYLREAAAAVDGEDLAGDEIRSDEVKNSASNIHSFARAMQRRAANVFLIGKLVGKLNRAGRNAIHQNFRRKSAGEAARQHDDSRFRNAIGGEFRP